MSLYDTVRADQLTARKNRAVVPANLLTTLLGEAGRVGKDAGGRDPTDEELIVVIRKFVKNIDENLKLRPGDEQATAERALLAAYLPEPLTDDEVKQAIEATFEPSDRNMKNMKNVVAHLRTMFGDRVDNGQVAVLLKKGL